ncbi:MAG TPA: DUF1648 domain-containing protein [Candidatus Sulfotelmatobacter sp.]|nr:DUF1648 domain-containing protein [Candidatus Sulfotelmatobacter sp.]
MERNSFKPPAWLIWLMWLALPITWSEYHNHWDQLPSRMAVHFDASWQPNGYTSREGAEHLGLGIMAAMLIFFTVGSFAARALQRSAAWPLLIVFYVVLGFLCYANHSIIEFNLRAHQSQPALVQAEFPQVP